MEKNKLFLLCAMLVGTWIQSAHAKKPTSDGLASTGPLEIRGKVITCEKDKGVCAAEGDAIVISGEADDPLKQILKADKITVFFKTPAEKENAESKKKSQLKETSQQKNDEDAFSSTHIKRAEAKGHVILTRGDTMIKADEATYDVTEHRITFKHSVRIKDGPDHYAECQRATYNVEKKIYTIEDQAKILLSGKGKN